MKLRSAIVEVLCFACVLMAAGFALIPIIWGLSTSLKLPQEIATLPVRWIPAVPTFRNFTDAVFEPRYLRYLANTLLVAGAVTAIALTIAVHSAYAAARFRFAGRDAFLMALWITIMVPSVAIVAPLYFLSIKVDLYDTLLVLVIVFVARLLPPLVWMLRGFVASVPVEIEEAAMIDGCSRVGAFYRVTLPLVGPGLVAGAVLVCESIWNEFLVSYSLILSDENRLIQVGIYRFITESGTEWGQLMAATVSSIVPVLLAYAVMQKAFLGGLTSGAVRG